MIGNLVIIFDIEFPNVLTNVQIDALGIRELIKKKKITHYAFPPRVVNNRT